MKLDESPGGAGIAEKLPLSHQGSSYLSSRGIKVMLAGRIRSKYKF